MVDSVSTGILADAAVLKEQKETVVGAMGRSVAECMLEALIERTEKQNIIAEGSCTLDEVGKVPKQADTEKERDQDNVDSNYSGGKAHTDDSDAY